MASTLRASPLSVAHISHNLTHTYPWWPSLKQELQYPLKTISLRYHAPVYCSQSSNRDSSLAFTNDDDQDKLVKKNSFFESLNPQETSKSSIHQENSCVEDNDHLPSNKTQSLKWPLWIFGPLVLLVTGMVPTLWLPLSSVFLGPSMAGLLSLVGLDCIFNMGASLFLLMADACARPWNGILANCSQVPLGYRLWNLGSSLLAFAIPLLMLLSSYKGLLQPDLPFISFLVLLGPYLLLLSIQMLTEILTWHWQSPVWLVAPVVYESYRLLQLMRSLRLGTEIGAPYWAIETLRGLVSWWVLILGIQIMRISWFIGSTSQNTKETF